MTETITSFLTEMEYAITQQHVFTINKANETMSYASKSTGSEILRLSAQFMTDSSYKSKFIAELEVENMASKIKKCPRCKTADLVKRSGMKNGKEWAFYGCTNFVYGCSYQEWAVKNEQK